jgi:hypothetical protein
MGKSDWGQIVVLLLGLASLYIVLGGKGIPALFGKEGILTRKQQSQPQSKYAYYYEEYE